MHLVSGYQCMCMHAQDRASSQPSGARCHVTSGACSLSSLCSLWVVEMLCCCAWGRRVAAGGRHLRRQPRAMAGRANRRVSGVLGRQEGSKLETVSGLLASEVGELRHALIGEADWAEPGARVAGCRACGNCRAAAPSRASNVEREGMDCHPGGTIHLTTTAVRRARRTRLCAEAMESPQVDFGCESWVRRPS